MENIFFEFPVKVYLGDHSLENLKVLKNKKVLFVYGGESLKNNGNYDLIKKILNKYKIESLDFGGNFRPDYKKVEEAISVCKENSIEAILGVGGSTVLDMSKIIAFGAIHDDYNDYLRHKKDPTDKDSLFTVLIPTYPAGGSETDSAAEIDNFLTGEHGSLYGIYGDVAILCPKLTTSLDLKQTEYCAIEQFVQASCSVIGTKGITKDLGNAVIKNILNSLKKLSSDLQCIDARTNLLISSSINVSGLISNVGSNIGYSIYKLEGIGEALLNMSYRDAIIVYFPLFLYALYFKDSEAVLTYIKDIFNKDTIEDGIKAIYELYDKYHMPKSYNDFGSKPYLNLVEVYASDCEPFTKDEVIDIFLSGFKSA